MASDADAADPTGKGSQIVGPNSDPSVRTSDEKEFNPKVEQQHVPPHTVQAADASNDSETATKQEQGAAAGQNVVPEQLPLPMWRFLALSLG